MFLSIPLRTWFPSAGRAILECKNPSQAVDSHVFMAERGLSANGEQPFWQIEARKLGSRLGHEAIAGISRKLFTYLSLRRQGEIEERPFESHTTEFISLSSKLG